MKLKSKRNLKLRFVVYITSTNIDLLQYNYVEYTKSKKVKIIIKIINGIWQAEENFIMRCTMYLIMISTVFLQIGNQGFFITYYDSMYMVFSVMDTEGRYEYVSNITVTESSRKRYISYFII